jgi:hypothetical protein
MRANFGHRSCTQSVMESQNTFVRNVQELRKRARKHIEQGAVTTHTASTASA